MLQALFELTNFRFAYLIFLSQPWSLTNFLLTENMLTGPNKKEQLLHFLFSAHA